ncbi:hypothetical protein [Rhodococcus rhodochrous]|uniref:Uncharacterized protein n=1 Tax=Rhodococcus rhodochrous KG-21 TaxID=1441923 RepID=A0A0M9WQV8_RHORH|nr:hypothetical protein [Rhodococcus rhodochrous]KOS58203.1 hypothetical protein Z051_01190 [Rhodococcus rhodochrous KG-21]
MLSPYDELPVHQTPYPLSVVANTDNGFDDGYFFGAFSAEESMFCFSGLRINPNTDMVGGYLGVMHNGIQRTVRFSRTWRQLCETTVGPFRLDIIEPYRHLRITLAENESNLSCELNWRGSAPAFLEAHHLATHRGRPTTDQSRYAQPGVVDGWIEIDGKRTEVDPSHWYGSRDHSWGVYFDRPPLAADPKWLPPHEPSGIPRALRFWTLFGAGDLAGFYAIHEDPEGRQVPMNDTFGTPFEGQFSIGWDKEVYPLVAAQHDLRLVPGTRLLAGATITLTDSDGGIWTQKVEPVGPPWVTSTIGYQGGSWKDGGSMRTYHGPGVSLEWDEFDFGTQPFDHVRYDGTIQPGLHGKEYLSRVTTTAPDGRQWVGAGHTELFLDGPYLPLGLQ